MFEQFSAAEKHTNPWAVMASVTTQAAVVGSAVLLSIIQVQKLDPGALLQPPPLIVPSLGPKPVRIVAVERPGGGTPGFTLSTEAARPLVVPTRIPKGIAYVDDGPQAAVVSMADLLSGGGTAGAAANSGVVQLGTLPVPPPRPPEVVKKTAEPPKAPVPIGGRVLEAMILNKVTPVYPPLARQARIAGLVRLHGVIGRDGRVERLRVLEGHPLLVPAALDAVRQWLYRPTLLNGEPVEVEAPIEVRFLLN